MKIVCVGDCGVDHYLPSHNLIAGGITANFARHARRAFGDADEIHVVSVTGSDPDNAKIARDGIQQAGIHCHLESLQGTTPVQYIEIRPDGEKDFMRYDEGVLHDFRLQRQHQALTASADLLVTPVFQQNRAMFDSVMVAATAGLVAVDFADFGAHPDFEHLEQHLPQIDIAFFGLSIHQQDLVQRISAYAAKGERLLIVTLGAAGSIAFGPDEVHRLAAIPVPTVVDTTGAGDAFAAGFLARYMHEGTVPESMQAGAERAAETVQHLGAVPF